MAYLPPETVTTKNKPKSGQVGGIFYGMPSNIRNYPAPKPLSSSSNTRRISYYSAPITSKEKREEERPYGTVTTTTRTPTGDLPVYGEMPTYDPGTYTDIPMYDAPEYDAPELGEMPIFGAPEYSEEEVSKLTQRAAAPGVRGLRSAMREAMGSGASENPNIKRMTLRQALAGYGQGLENIMAGAARTGRAEYGEKYGREYNEALMGYQGEVDTRSREYATAGDVKRTEYQTELRRRQEEYEGKRETGRLAYETERDRRRAEYEQQIRDRQAAYDAAMQKYRDATQNVSTTRPMSPEEEAAAKKEALGKG